MTSDIVVAFNDDEVHDVVDAEEIEFPLMVIDDATAKPTIIMMMMVIMIDTEG
jgi:hypothetical protein